MANNLRKFNTYSDYEAAVLVKPAVSLIAATDEVIFDQKDAPVPPTPTFSGLTAHFNINDVGEYALFNGGGSGSGSGSGGALPSAMIIDGTEVEVTATYQFDTVGEHIVNYSFADNQIPNEFMNGGGGNKFPHLVGIEIGDAITSIGDFVFYHCSGITSCTISSGVTSIGGYAFGGCSGLTSIEIPSSVTSIGNSAFLDCSSLTSITVDSNNTIYDSRNDCNAIIETNTNKLLRGCQNTVIPNTVTSIGEGAFGACSGLTSIDIPNSVTTISSYAFDGCSGLTSCTIGSGVTSIGDFAFSNCSSLTSITSNVMTAPSVGTSTFANIHPNGTLTVPSGSSGYDVWMRTIQYYLGYYNWTKVEQ